MGDNGSIPLIGLDALVGCMAINARAKGQKNELKAEKLLTLYGFQVFRLYQPPYAKQGAIDMIAIGKDSVRFIQVRSNQYGDLRPLKKLEVAPVLSGLKEVWVFHDRIKDPVIRRIA